MTKGVKETAKLEGGDHVDIDKVADEPIGFFTREQARNLRMYKYSGGDSGLAYVYFYNPVAKCLVD